MNGIHSVLRAKARLAGVLSLLFLSPGALAQEPKDTLAPIDRDVLSGVEDRVPVRNAEQNYYEFQAYHYLLMRAHKASPQALAAGARRDLTLAHLFEEPTKYRGELLHLEGTLRRMRQFDASKLAAQQGVKTVYEGWIFSDESPSDPYCVLLTELPEGVRVAEKLSTRVTYDGYFFKRYRYKAGDGYREAPLLIGRTFVVNASPVAAETNPSSLANGLFLALLVVLLVSAVLIGSLTWWFRRGDRLVRGRLATSRAQAQWEAMQSLENAENP